MEQDEPAESPSNRRRQPAALVCAVLFSMIVVYALGVGPVAKLYSKGLMSPRASQMAEAFYAPMSSIVGHYAPAGRLYQWYCWEVWKIPKTAYP